MEKRTRGHTDDDDIDENLKEESGGRPCRRHKHRKNKDKPETDVKELIAPNKKQKKKDKKVHEDSGETTKKSKKKRKRSPALEENEEIEESLNAKEDLSETEELQAELQMESVEELEFPEQDLATLLSRIERAIPSNDSTAFRTRVKKLDWPSIAFNDHTADKCRDAWMYIQKRQRQFRLLSEMVGEAKEWLRKPYAKGKAPDLPKRPLSSYMLFYLDRKDLLLSQNAGIKMPELSRLVAQEYNELPDEDRNKYIKLAADRREQYETDVEEFYIKHPDIPRPSDRLASEYKSNKKPRKPFAIFFEDQLKKEKQVPDKSAFKEQCKETWKNMPEDKKIVWIERALDLTNKYEDQLNRKNPDYTPTTKLMLTKKEKRLVERMDGKPDKPPNSAYSLYSRILLKGEELKSLNPIQKMKTIAIKWKDLPQEEKDNYRDRVTLLMEQYKVEYSQYLESLPQEKRDLELQTNAPKRKGKAEEIPFVKKPKQEDIADMPKEKNTGLIETVIPQTWEDMDDGERSMYVKYVQKIKDYFDSQHQAAIEDDNAASESESESSD